MQKLKLIDVPQISCGVKTKCEYCGEDLYITDTYTSICCLNDLCPKKVATTLYYWLGKEVDKVDLCDLCTVKTFTTPFDILELASYKSLIKKDVLEKIELKVYSFSQSLQKVLGLLLADEPLLGDLLKYLRVNRVKSITSLYTEHINAKGLQMFIGLNQGVFSLVTFSIYRKLRMYEVFLKEVTFEYQNIE